SLQYSVINKSKGHLNLTLGAKGSWERITRQIYEAENFNFFRKAGQSTALAAKHLSLSCGAAAQEFALALGSEGGLDFADVSRTGEAKTSAAFTGKKWVELAAGKSGKIRWAAGKKVKLKKGESLELAICIGAGLDEISAAASAIELQRSGPSRLL